MVVKDLLLQSGEVALRGKVLFPSLERTWPLAILCHGIPGGPPVEGDTGYDALARRLAGRGIGACYFNFRGTGFSGGDFSLAGWVDDLETVLKAAGRAEGAFEGCDRDRLALMGFSGGGAVSIVCSARRGGVKGVATLASPSEFSRLITPEGVGDFIAYARYIGIIRDPSFPPSEEAFYREMVSCSPVKEVGRLAPIPLLLVHGDMDDVVPTGEAYRLYEAAGEPKELYIARGGGHKLRLDHGAIEKAASWIVERLRP